MQLSGKTFHLSTIRFANTYFLISKKNSKILGYHFITYAPKLHSRYTFFIFYSIFSDFTGVISMRHYMCLVGSCQCRLNSALESCGTGVLTGVIVLAVYVSQIND